MNKRIEDAGVHGSEMGRIGMETFGDLMIRMAAERGDATALVFGARRTSFARLDRRSARGARALLRDGAVPGGRIGYLGRNSDRYFELLFAAGRAGVAMVPIEWRLATPEIARLLDDAGLTHLFVELGFLPVARAASGGAARLVVTEGAGDAEAAGYEAWLAAGGESPALPAVDVNAPVLQLYTSGTTGQPKGVMLSHANALAMRDRCIASQVEGECWDAGDVSLLCMPVAHIAGTGWGLVGLHGGAASVILPQFDAGQIASAIPEHGVTRMFLVPSALDSLLAISAPPGAYASLRTISYGASPIPAPLLERAIARFGCGFVQNYGATETCGAVTSLSPADHRSGPQRHALATGRALPGVDLRILGPGGEPVPAGTVGEVVVRSPANMLGYWRQPETTAETLRDGWIHTGDLGRIDGEGYLYVIDRLKDMIISGGENVYPAEVEAVLRRHPAIRDVAVIGVPDPRWGEAVTAIALADDPPPDGTRVLAWARQWLAAYKVPKRIVFRDALPRNANGKVMKRALREEFQTGVFPTRHNPDRSEDVQT